MPCYMREGPAGPTFLCGDLGAHCAECGYVGDNLCDYPVGDGKTCDRPLCDAHANLIGPNLHYCSAHLSAWERYKESGGLSRDLANVHNFAKPCASSVRAPDGGQGNG